MQGLVVVGLIFEEIPNISIKCVKVTGVHNIGQGHQVKVPAMLTDGRTDGWTDGRTDGQTDGRTENRTPISHPATSRCDKNKSTRTDQ